jgi:transcriptional regulator with XRE-family HTH domain
MEASLQQSLGAAARAARLRLGLTQAQVAKRATMTPGIYGRVERGGMMPSVQTLLRLCAALEVTPDVLLSQGLEEARAPRGAPPPVTAEPPELSRIVHQLRRWPCERLALLRKLLDVADMELGQ